MIVLSNRTYKTVNKKQKDVCSCVICGGTIKNIIGTYYSEIYDMETSKTLKVKTQFETYILQLFCNSGTDKLDEAL